MRMMCLLPHVEEYDMKQSMTAVRGIRSELSSRLTAGYLHTCAVKEQRAGGGSEVKCMELKLHFTAVQPSLSPILLQRGLSFNLSWTEKAGSSDLTGGSWILAVECETYYLISPRPLCSPAEGETLSNSSEGIRWFHSPYRWWEPVSVSLTDPWRRRGLRFMQKLISVGVFVQSGVRSDGDVSHLLYFWRVSQTKPPLRPQLGRHRLCSGLWHFIFWSFFTFSLRSPDGWLNLNHELLPKTPTIAVFCFTKIKPGFMAGKSRVPILTDGFYLLIIKLPACVCVGAESRLSELHIRKCIEQLSFLFF